MRQRAIAKFPARIAVPNLARVVCAIGIDVLLCGLREHGEPRSRLPALPSALGDVCCITRNMLASPLSRRSICGRTRDESRLGTWIGLWLHYSSRSTIKGGTACSGGLGRRPARDFIVGVAFVSVIGWLRQRLFFFRRFWI
jgi:hypothetical protein